MKRLRVEVHDFNHLLQITQTFYSADKHHTFDNARVFFPSATEEDIDRLHAAFEEHFASKPSKKIAAEGGKPTGRLFLGSECFFRVYPKTDLSELFPLEIKKQPYPTQRRIFDRWWQFGTRHTGPSAGTIEAG